jgi:hypothetical protein
LNLPGLQGLWVVGDSFDAFSIFLLMSPFLAAREELHAIAADESIDACDRVVTGLRDSP